MSRACAVMLCQSAPHGLVGVNVLVNDAAQRRQLPMCVPCADELSLLLASGEVPALTPDDTLYLRSILEPASWRRRS